MVLLCVAGLACCVAMSMPQVHIVAYCGDLGYGVGRGAEMLAVMFGFGIISRIGSGFVADRVGGVGTLLIGSVLQGAALVLYLMFDGLASLYVISALFGLFQGGIVPSYAIIVREYFPPQEAGTRLGIVLMATLFGMALGGWTSGLDLRPHRLIRCGLRAWAPVESAQRLDRAVAADASRAWCRARDGMLPAPDPAADIIDGGTDRADGEPAPNDTEHQRRIRANEGLFLDQMGHGCHLLLGPHRHQT